MNFANSVYAEFQKMRYGIQSCRDTGELWLNEIRKDIVNYQSNDDGQALCDVSIQHMGWLPVYYPTTDDSCDYMPPWCDMSKYQVQRCNGGPSSIGMAYAGQTGGANLIEVNAGGCITRININPAITINTGAAFTYVQNCSNPQTVWTIVHNLGYVPNLESNNVVSVYLFTNVKLLLALALTEKTLFIPFVATELSGTLSVHSSFIF